MAIKIECDGGCGTVIPAHARSTEHSDGCRGCRQGHDGHAVGRLDPVIYCDGCHAEWDEYQAAENAHRLDAVHMFETWRTARRAELRAGPLKRLPDDFDAP